MIRLVGGAHPIILPLRCVSLALVGSNRVNGHPPESNLARGDIAFAPTTSTYITLAVHLPQSSINS